VVGIFLIINAVIGGQYKRLGVDFVLYHLGDLEHNPCTKIFPLVVRCLIFRIGPSGSVEKLDEMCVLLMNLINQQIYIVIWFYLAVTFAVFSLALLHRIISIFCTAERIRQIEIQTGSMKSFRGMAARMGFGDWIILLHLLKHFQVSFARDILSEVLAVHKKNLMESQSYYWIDPIIPPSSASGGVESGLANFTTDHKDYKFVEEGNVKEDF